MTLTSAAPGTGILAPTIDTSQAKPTPDQVGHRFPNITPEEVQQLDPFRRNLLEQYPNATFEQLRTGHGFLVASNSNFIW